MIFERDGTAGVHEAFVALPHALYRDDPRWIPEEPAAIERAFSTANRWHERGRARTFVVPERARVAAFFDPAASIDGAPAAFFGYWETDGALDVDRALFARVIEWARRHGATRLYGPIQFNTANGYRVLLDAERDALPFPGEPYNPPWYGPELEALGFALERRYFTQHLDRARARATLERHRPLLTRLERRGYRFAALDELEWLTRLPELHTLADRIFAGNFGYTPTAYPEFAAAFGKSLLRRRWPDLSVVAHAPSGELAGFCLVFPHYGPLVVQAAGTARVAASALDYERDARRLDGRWARAAVLKTIAVSPSHRARGVAEAITAWLLERAEACADELWGALIREDNASRRLATNETPALRRYGLYAQAI